jgi:hypothetical protein
MRIIHFGKLFREGNPKSCPFWKTSANAKVTKNIESENLFRKKM